MSRQRINGQTITPVSSKPLDLLRTTSLGQKERPLLSKIVSDHGKKKKRIMECGYFVLCVYARYMLTPRSA